MTVATPEAPLLPNTGQDAVTHSSKSELGETADGANETSTDEVQPPTIPPRRFYPGLLPRPNCTHIVMDYLFTNDLRCDACDSPPRLGWLYVCQQDCYSEAIARRQMDMLTEMQGKEQLPSRVEELQACGMSRSILEQIKQGSVFDPFQIEVLKNQKINMLRVMEKQLSQEHATLNLPADHAHDVIAETKEPTECSLSSNVTLRAARNVTTKIVQKLGHFRRRSQDIPRCGFKCCHACRPYLRDRAYVSLSAAAVGDIEPERFVAQERPISKVSAVETLGLRPIYHPRFRTSQESSEESFTDTSYTISSNEDASEYDIAPNGDSSNDRLPTQTRVSPSQPSRTTTMPPARGHTIHSSASEHSIHHAADTANDSEGESDGLFRRLKRNMNSKWLPRRSRSSISLPQDIPLHSIRHAESHQALSNLAQHNQLHPESADLGLQTRITSATSVSAPAEDLSHVQYTYPRRYYANLPSKHSSGQASLRSDLSQSSASSDEIAVQGGVALTEEAVETKIPDIITQV